LEKTAEYWIKHLNLEPHPEGGFYREIYRANEMIQSGALPERYSSDRNFGTSIYFLLQSDSVSHFHRLQSDEIWHFYTGSSLSLHMLSDENGYETQSLGPDPEDGQQYQVIIPENTWFGATVDKANSFSLVGCTMAPGFDFRDFELGKREDLVNKYPDQKKLVIDLTKD